MSEHPAISKVFTAPDGYPAIAFPHAAIVCARCVKDGGWREGTTCPWECGVELVDVSAEEDAKVMDRLREEDAERRRYREERRAARKRASGQEHGSS